MSVTNSDSSENLPPLVSAGPDTHLSGASSNSSSSIGFQEIDLSNSSHLSSASSSSSMSNAIEGIGSQFGSFILMEPKKKNRLPISRPSSRPTSRPPTPTESTSSSVSASAKPSSRPPSPFVKGEPRKPIPMNPEWKKLYNAYEHTPTPQTSTKDSNPPRKPQQMNPAHKGYLRPDGRPMDEQDKVKHRPVLGSDTHWTKVYCTFESQTSPSLTVDTSTVLSPKNYPLYEAPNLTPTSGSEVQRLVSQYTLMGSPRAYPEYVPPSFSPSFNVSVKKLLNSFEQTSESSSSLSSPTSSTPSKSFKSLSLSPSHSTSSTVTPLLVSPVASPTHSTSARPKQLAVSPAASPSNGTGIVRELIQKIESPHAPAPTALKASPSLVADPV